jgi:hypothetical protein
VCACAVSGEGSPQHSSLVFAYVVLGFLRSASLPQHAMSPGSAFFSPVRL